MVSQSVLSIFILVYLLVTKLRILFQVALDGQQVREAESFGLLYPFLNELICDQVFSGHPWLNGCRVGKYHISLSEDPVATIMVESETSTLANEQLARHQNEDVRLFVITRQINEDIERLGAFVDIPRERPGLSGWDLNHDGVPSMRSVLTYFAEVNEVTGVTLNRNNFHTLKGHLAQQLVYQLKCIVSEKTRVVNVIPQRILDSEDQTIVSSMSHFQTTFDSPDSGFPEHWKMGLQAAVDALGVQDGTQRNFRLPTYGDLSTEGYVKIELGMFVQNFESHLDSASDRSIECRLLDSIFQLLGPLKYYCYPLGHVLSQGRMGMYVTVRVQMLRSMLTPHLGRSEYSDVTFLELLKNKCEWASFSVFTLRDVPSYGFYSDPDDEENFIVVVQMFAIQAWGIQQEDIAQGNNLVGLANSESVILSKLKLRLDIPVDLFRCRMIEYANIGERTALEAHIQIHKNTRYWDEKNPQSVPLRLSQALNVPWDYPMNVRFRHKPKYPGLAI
ncbi:hypothetical protein CRM22_004847 [Opisthorchis felineus]|uniref:Uncharacterized protein n=1 Tax=Opisthorchis felineus TaxID=147828 RepID=A0A4S2LV83_OPIFE|nr:hypothetical protein CRM22_004847 [Opisthorchis felineus]